jgi:uncharacterized membrane protein
MWRRIAPGEAPRFGTLLRGIAVIAVLALSTIAWLLRARGFEASANGTAVALVGVALIAIARGVSARLAASLLAVLALLGTAAWTFHLPAVYWPPVAINFAMATVFAASLRAGEPLVLRFARLETPDVTPALVEYCRRLTLVWACYLALLGFAGIAIACHGDERLGAWWCGALDYAAIVLLFVGERAWRRARGQAPSSLLAQARNVRQALRNPRP